MPRLTWRNVYQVDLGPLKSAIGQWNTMVGKLEEVSTEAHDGMLKKANKAEWAGVNADVTRPFIKAIADEITDAHTEAKDLHKELSDAYRALKSIQDELQTKVDDARRKGIEISDGKDGQIICKYPPQPGHQNEVISEKRRKELQTLGEELAALVARANSRDSYTAGILAKIHGGDPHNFAKNGSIDAYKAKRALEITRKGAEASNKELRKLAEILKYNKDDPSFSHAFFKGLGGPKETLEYYARMSIDGTGASGKARLDAVQDLQRYLGPTLATATDPDHKGYLNWGPAFRRLGTKDIRIDALGFQPKGYQLLGGILRYGNYDKKFLTPIAEHVVQLQHDHPTGYWKTPFGPDAQFGLDPNGKKNSGYDPVTSVLEALGHSPEASEAFFSKDPGVKPVSAYDENGKIDPNKSIDYSYLDELTREDYHWNNDGTSPVRGEQVLSGKDALGHALESATIGNPYDEPAVGGNPHTDSRASIVDKLIRTVDKNHEFVSRDISDSMGKIAGEYMPEINKAVAGADGKVNSDLFITAHTRDFDTQASIRFLDALGRHPEGHAEATLGAQRYQADLMREVSRQPDHFSGSPEDNMRQVARNSGTLEGILGSARHDAVITEGQEAEKKFNEELEKRGEIIKQIVGLPVGAAAERVPVGGDLITGITEQVIDSAVESQQKHTLEDDASSGATVSFETREQAGRWAQYAARNAGYPPGVNATDFARDISNETADGYDHGEQVRENGYDNKVRRSGD
ncbi:hypothetical protein [Streptomyces spirodelae]|uniref:AG2 protein n=1 Tax=Streptomyces spirodelae TaxID=2812904 RepID=A0ABS3WRK1_9ACTN|nr:hypothetical protein [Streptomyces spirodelae]MBO8185482.1 hypothetical protein [Streptomyces spirodelae]